MIPWQQRCLQTGFESSGWGSSSLVRERAAVMLRRFGVHIAYYNLKVKVKKLGEPYRDRVIVAPFSPSSALVENHAEAPFTSCSLKIVSGRIAA
jgi:hypothetical protein